MSEQPSSKRSRLSAIQRSEAVDLYETGVLNGMQLARRYGVHRDVIYRHFKAVGAIKGRRVHETIRDLERDITARQKAKQRAQWQDDNRRLDYFIAGGAAVEQMMQALLRADREGKLGDFDTRLHRL